MPNELHLIDRLRQSDYDAFSTLYRRYSPRVYHTVLRMFGNADVAADVVQDLFLKIWEKRADMDPSGNFEAYIHVVARNLAYSYLRNELDKLENISTAEAAAMCAGGDDPSKELEAMSTGEFIRRIIDSMPPVRRQIFIMSRFDSLCVKPVRIFFFKVSVAHGNRKNRDNYLFDDRLYKERFVTEHINAYMAFAP